MFVLGLSWVLAWRNLSEVWLAVGRAIVAVLQVHTIWKVVLVLLMNLSNLPRFGCLCMDGGHLPYCQKMFDHVTEQITQLFQPATKEKACSCCGGCEHEGPVPSPCGNDSSSPCECQITVEGPSQSSPPRDSFHPGVDLLCWVSLGKQLGIQMNEPHAMLHLLNQIALSNPAISGMVRLNI